MNFFEISRLGTQSLHLFVLSSYYGPHAESDIYECVNEQGEIMAMKIHRLGRVSFKNVKSKRDYLLHRKSASWMYMSRLAAVREYTFMQVWCVVCVCEWEWNEWDGTSWLVGDELNGVPTSI